MNSVDSLSKVSNGLKATLARLNDTNNRLNARIDTSTKDTTRSSSYTGENVAAARAAALPGMQADLDSMREIAAAVEPQREFWADRNLLLSRVAFDSDPALDAQLRIRYATELAAYDLPLLTLTQRNALLDAAVPQPGALALAWACELARRRAGYEAMDDFASVEIPGQAAALAMIDSCDATLAEAELLVAGASGVMMNPAQKLTLGRRMTPNRPTQHNSPGRTLAA